MNIIINIFQPCYPLCLIREMTLNAPQHIQQTIWTLKWHKVLQQTSGWLQQSHCLNLGQKKSTFSFWGWMLCFTLTHRQTVSVSTLGSLLNIFLTRRMVSNFQHVSHGNLSCHDCHKYDTILHKHFIPCSLHIFTDSMYNCSYSHLK